MLNIHHMSLNKKGTSFGTIVAVFGSILIALGVAWLIAQNWHQMSSALKIIILLAATSGAYIAGTMFRVKNYFGIAKALFALGALFYTLSIFLIAQIFATSTSFQGQAWLWLIAWVGVLASAYIFDSSISLIIALIEFIHWLSIQFLAFLGNNFFDLLESNKITIGILAFYFLAAGVLVYGVSLLHKSKGHKFARVYQWWTAFYFLLFTYILSFQMLLPLIWPKSATTSTPAIVFLFFLGIVALIALVSGITSSISNKTVQNKEVIGVIAVVALLAILTGLTSFVSGQSGYWWIFSDNKEVSTSLWALWISINLIFILTILAVIFYGTWQKLPKLINLGIIFFALDIITRYIGFMIDLWGYTSLSIIFITGGIILLGGGWFIEKWRRNLIIKVSTKTKPK